MHMHKHSSNVHSPKAEFTPSLSASSVERLANQRLHLALDEVSDWLDAQRSTLTALSLVYADMPQTLDHLEDNIRRVIADILPQMLEKVIENWTSRLDYIRASRGRPMPEIIFKM
ncbi:hypothetical protein TNCV_1473861 [Trichonephila clavipes]|nr:hypothetical protein TNCV_1473861 [Trichonephila clavipes]